ncbi:MAG: adenosine kinase, partial [Alistipes sp.]|nr:adenosine kinase [Alistipes sp.]
MNRVIGIGNALTDVLVNLRNEDVLAKHNIARGSMSLVDSELQSQISKEVAGLPHSLSLGGSADNTIRAMARLGTKVGFIGKVGHDNTGDRFEQALHNLGIEGKIFRGDSASGKCISLVSPDGEPTMLTHLGAAAEMHASDIKPEIFNGYDTLYIEGYLVQEHS